MKRLPVFVVLCAALASAAFADGMAFFKDPSRVEWSLLGENAQTALIHFYQGREALLISIAPEKSISRVAAVWLFPVPCAPEKVGIDILSGGSQFEGNDIVAGFRSGLYSVAVGSAALSTFPLSVFYSPMLFYQSYRPEHLWLAAGAHGEPFELSDVEIHAQIDKMGLTTELVTARTAEALARHLAERGLDLPRESLAFLDSYIGQDYSFVISFKSPPGPATVDARVPFPKDLLDGGTGAKGARPTMGHGRTGPDGRYIVVEEPMTDEEYAAWVEQFDPKTERLEFRRGRGGVESGPALSVFVTFSTDRIYFPLKPSAYYGSRRIPVSLLVTGYVDPRLTGRLRGGSSVGYLSGSLDFDSDASPFWLGRPRSEVREFTEIKIDAPADAFSDDLWISAVAPFRIRLIDFLSATAGLWIILFYAGFSALASLAAGTLSFRKDRPSGRRLALHGLWNCLSMLAFLPATAGLLTTKRLPADIKEEITNRGLNVKVRIKDNRKILYAFLFYLVFLLLVVATERLLALTLLSPPS